MLMYVLHRYDVPQLQNMAATRLRQVCSPTENPNDFIAMLYAIDSDCNPEDRTLWNIVMSKIKSNIVYLLANPEFRKLLTEMPQLNFDLLAMLDSGKPQGTTRPAIDTPDDEDDDLDAPISSHRSGGRRLG